MHLTLWLQETRYFFLLSLYILPKTRYLVSIIALYLCYGRIISMYLCQLEQNAYFCNSIVVKIYTIKVREKTKITINIKVIRRHNENLLTLAFYKSHNNYVADKLFHTLNTKNNDVIFHVNYVIFHVNSKAPSTLL